MLNRNQVSNSVVMRLLRPKEAQVLQPCQWHMLVSGTMLTQTFLRGRSTKMPDQIRGEGDKG